MLWLTLLFIAGLAAALYGVFLLWGLAWALIVGGVVVMAFALRATAASVGRKPTKGK